MHGARVRDEGLRRVSSATRWVAALAVVGTAAIAGIVARAVPGRATSPPPGGVTTPTTTDGGGFQAPAQLPVPSQQVPVVRTGAS